MAKIKFKMAIRDCYCRGCNKVLRRKEDPVITTTSYRGDYFFCVECVEAMYKLVKKGPDEN